MLRFIFASYVLVQIPKFHQAGEPTLTSLDEFITFNSTPRMLEARAATITIPELWNHLPTAEILSNFSCAQPMLQHWLYDYLEVRKHLRRVLSRIQIQL